ncbi:hypothetical protein CFP56_043394 [Quercus suber]|uniref:Uncharacterized protein n=1 Tax=Quercus suber TaxID=58331 RepID=A0AAW0ISA0_QUESU
MEIENIDSTTKIVLCDHVKRQRSSSTKKRKVLCGHVKRQRGSSTKKRKSNFSIGFRSTSCNHEMET